MSDRIAQSPDASDERIAELISWTGKGGMPGVHAMLLDLQCRRSTDRDAEFVALRKALWERLEQCQKQAERIRELEADRVTPTSAALTAVDVRQLRHHVESHRATCAYSCSLIEQLLDGATTPELRAAIIALLDSDAPAGELRRAMAELVGRR